MATTMLLVMMLMVVRGLKNLFVCKIERELEVNPETTLNPKVVRTMKALQDSYNEDAYKIVDQTEQDEAEGEIFFIDLATIMVAARSLESLE